MNWLTSIFFLAGWILSMAFGREKGSLVPMGAAFVFLLITLWLLRKSDQKNFIVALLLLPYGAIGGMLLPTALQYLGLAAYPLSTYLPPGWVLSLYLLLMPAIIFPLSFLENRPFFPFLFALVAAPIGSGLAAFFGALEVLSPYYFPVLAILFGCFLTIIFQIKKKLEKLAAHALDLDELNRPITVYFDGICQVCAKELKYLQKRKQTGRVNYYSITTKEQMEQDEKNVTFEEAMKEINAIDDKGNVIKGVPVFYEIYARTDLPLLAVLIKAPGLRPIAHVLYKIWASYRLAKRNRVKP